MERQREKLEWYLNRLRRMSGGEVLYRLRKKVGMTLRLAEGPSAPPPAPVKSLGNMLWLSPGRVTDSSLYIKAAERVLAGSYDVFALSNVKLGMPPRWNRDPKTGTLAPLTFGMTLDYRNEALVGDIKYLWEPNRHLELTTLCQAYWVTEDLRYLEAFKVLLRSWIEQCPYPLGPNWASSLEAGIRLLNWSICWQLIGGVESPLFRGDDGQAFKEAWLGSIWEHSTFIAENWSRYSSANNHLIGEATGLFLAAVTWPVWSESGAWRAKSHAILKDEAIRQVHPDGVLKEQAVSYMQFVGDFLLISGLVARSSGWDFGHEYWANLERMLDFLGSIMDASGNLPMIGDADDGYAVRLEPRRGFCPYRSLLATGGVLFDRPDLLAKAGRVDDKTRWLIGAEAGEGLELSLDSPELHAPVCRGFPSGGYYLLGTDWGSGREIRCVADVGPLGYLSIAAHGHADALSFTFSVGGNEFLVDPGTYSYHTQKAWRDHFRGTSAHNTLCVDGRDQSLSGGNFMWLRHANARLLEWRDGPDAAELVGEHDGYRNLKDPVKHLRSWRLEKRERILTVRDSLDCFGDHQVERWWHFSEDCCVEMTDLGALVSNGEQRIGLALDPKSRGQRDLHRGSENPIAGWVSRRFDRKEPAYSLVERVHICGATQLDASIQIM
jgi:hypothetical protein